MLIGGLYPAIVQQFQVKPNEQAKEAPYIQQNIDATRQAYGIDDAQRAGRTRARPTPGQPASCAGRADHGGQLSGCSTRTSSRRPSSSSQQQRKFYQFPSTLDVDRYPDNDGKEQDTVIGAARAGPRGHRQQRNWINDHFIYTHGFGASRPRATSVDANGSPDFTESSMPTDRPAGPRLRAARSTSARSPTELLDRRRAQEGARLRERGQGPGHDDLPGQGRREPVQPVHAGRVRGEVPASRRSCSLGAIGNGVEDPLQPHPQAARREGRAVADDRRRPLSGGRRQAASQWIVDGYTTTNELPLLLRAPRSARPTTDSLTRQPARVHGPAATRSTTSATR